MEIRTALNVIQRDDAVWLVPPALSNQQGVRGAAIADSNDPQRLANSWNSTVVTESVVTNTESNGGSESAGGHFSLRLDGTKATTKVVIRDAFRRDESHREELRVAFADFCRQVDELEVSGVLAPGASRLISQKVAEAIPVMLDVQTPAAATGPICESLFFRYGLRPRQVDLLPGMRLRIDTTQHQLVTPAQSPLDGYASVGTAYLTVSARGGDRRLTFDNFLSAMGGLSVPRSNPALVSGALDLENKGDERRHYQLFFPSAVPPSHAQNSTLGANITLAGADRLSELDDAYPTPEQPSNVVYSIFRGRALVIPEIQVWVNRRPMFVPIGTTVRQLIESGTNWGLTEMFAANNPHFNAPEDRALFVERFWGAGMHIIGRTKIDSYVPLNVQFLSENAPPPNTALFDLPLVQGDSVRWQV